MSKFGIICDNTLFTKKTVTLYVAITLANNVGFQRNSTPTVRR